MGLLTGLLTLPLAPVRGVALVADQLAKEAERELEREEVTATRELAELQWELGFGTLDEEEYTQREQALLAQLDRQRKGSHG